MKVILATGIASLEQELKVLLEKDHQVAEIYYREADIPAGEVLVLSPHLQGEMELLDLVYNLRQRETRIVLLAGDLEPAVVWRAFNLGVYDIFFDPVKVRDIVEAVQFPKRFKDVSEMLTRRGIKEQQAVAVREVEKIVVKEVKKVTRQEIHTWWSAGGGEGKTTLAVSQAVQLARVTGEKVALLDFKEATPGCSWCLDIAPYDVMPVYDAIERGCLTPGILEENLAEYPRLSNLKVFTGVRLDRMGIFLEKHFSTIIEALRSYPYVIVDTNPGIFFAGTAAGLRRADRINMVLEPTYRSLAETLPMLDFVCRNWGIKREQVRAYVNKMHFRGLDPETVRTGLKGLEVGGYFSYNPAVVENLNKGVPVVSGFEALLQGVDLPGKGGSGRKGFLSLFRRGREHDHQSL